jgi:hypothetical protein
LTLDADQDPIGGITTDRLLSDFYQTTEVPNNDEKTYTQCPVGSTPRLLNRANAWELSEEQQELDYLLHWPHGWMDAVTELVGGMALVITCNAYKHDPIQGVYQGCPGNGWCIVLPKLLAVPSRHFGKDRCLFYDVIDARTGRPCQHQ